MTSTGPSSPSSGTERAARRTSSGSKSLKARLLHRSALIAIGVLVSSLALAGAVRRGQGTTRVAAGGSAHPPAPQPPAYPQNVADHPVPRIGDKPWVIAPDWLAYHERLRSAPGRAGAPLAFLGDSITEGWGMTPAYREHFGKYAAVDLGLGGDTTQNVLWRIEHGALDGMQPQVLVILIGINNLAGGFSPEDTASGVRAVVTAARERLPATHVLLLALLPARREPGHPLRQRIRDTNRLLEPLAEPGHVDLLDLGSVLLEPDGSISSSIMRDYLHPTAAGFERLSRALEPFLAVLLTRERTPSAAPSNSPPSSAPAPSTAPSSAPPPSQR